MGDGSPTGTGAYPVLVAGEPCLAPVEGITGYSSVPGLSGVYIDTLTFVIVNTGEEDIDLSRATVTVMAGDYLEILTRSGGSLSGPGTWTAALPRNGDGSMPLRPGEECAIRIHLDQAVPAGETPTVRIRLPGERPCSITGQAAAPADDAGGGIAASSPED